MPIATANAADETKSRSEIRQGIVNALGPGDLSVLQAIVDQRGGTVMTVEGSPLDKILSTYRPPIVYKRQPPPGVPEETRMYEIKDSSGYIQIRSLLSRRDSKEKGMGEPRGPWCLGSGCMAAHTGCGELFTENPIKFKRPKQELVLLVYFSLGYFSGVKMPLAANGDNDWLLWIASHCTANPKLGFVYALEDIAATKEETFSVADPELGAIGCDAIINREGGVKDEYAQQFPLLLGFAMGFYTARVSETGANPELLPSRTDVIPPLAAYCRDHRSRTFGEALAQTIPKPLE